MSTTGTADGTRETVLHYLETTGLWLCAEAISVNSGIREDVIEAELEELCEEGDVETREVDAETMYRAVAEIDEPLVEK